MTIGLTEIALSRYRDAIASLEQYAYKFDHRREVIFCKIAGCYLELDEYDNAFEAVEKSMAIGQNYKPAWELKHKCLLALGRDQDAQGVLTYIESNNWAASADGKYDLLSDPQI